MVSYSDIEEMEIKNPTVFVGFFLGGCIFFTWKLIEHVFISM